MENSSAREGAAEGGKRGLSVLDQLRIPAFSVGHDSKLAYTNEAFAELTGMPRERAMGMSIRSLVKAEKSGVKQVLETGESVFLETWATVNNEKHYIECDLTPLTDEKGKTAGVLGLFKDVTSQKAVFESVRELVEKIEAGELSFRANVEADGDSRLLVDGVNGALDAVTAPLLLATDYMNKIGKGDIPEKITDNCNGDFNGIKNSLNNCIDGINGITSELSGLASAVSKGDLTRRGDVDRFCGAYKDLIQDINGLIDSIAAPLEELMACLGKMAVNDLTVKVSKEYSGIWNDLKGAANDLHGLMERMRDTVIDISNGELKKPEESLRKIGQRGENDTLIPAFIKLIESINGVIGEVETLAGAVTAGDLSKRGDENEYQGAYRDIIQGMNGLIESVANPLSELIGVLKLLADNDYTQKMVKSYSGAWDELKKATNTTLDKVTTVQDMAIMISDGDLSGLEGLKKLGKRNENDRLVPAFIKMMEAINGVIGEVNGMTNAVLTGELNRRGSTDRFQGAYKEMVQGMNGLIDSIAAPLEELMAMLNRLSMNDYTQKIVKDYSGVWDGLKGTANLTLDRMLNIEDVAIKVSNGDLSKLDEFKKIGRRCENDQLIPSFTQMMEAIKSVMGMVESLTRAIMAGDLSKRADETLFQGAYREIVHGMNGVLESISNPLNELIEVLNRMSVNDYTQKMVKSYSGAWDELKKATNTTLDKVTTVQDMAIMISDGDLSGLESLKKIGKRSENDRLVPAFIKMMEAIKNLIEDMQMLAEESVNGKLSIRADAAKHLGEYRKVVEGVNNTLDAVVTPITEALACLKEMAGGNLDVEMKGDYKGDHALIKDNLHATLAALNDILNQVAIAVDQVTTGAHQVSDSSQSLSQAATESASSLEEITASMHELTSQTNLNAENATQANQLATQARQSAEKGEEQMGNMVKAMSDINESAANISKIIKAIDEIAFQTNLLALNAAVEAARAGKHGKGFTVVAEEVRNLAQRSATAAKETAEMIEGSIKKTEVGARIAEETSRALEEIVTGSTKVTDLIGEIASASKEQAQGIGQINQGLSQVDQVTQQVTANAEESASASEELSSQSLQLKQMLTKFQLKKQGFNMSASGLPEGFTPEILQMIKGMLQSQQMGAAGSPSLQSKFSGGKPLKKTEPVTKPSDVIALDDKEFGNF